MATSGAEEAPPAYAYSAVEGGEGNGNQPQQPAPPSYNPNALTEDPAIASAPSAPAAQYVTPQPQQQQVQMRQPQPQPQQQVVYVVQQSPQPQPNIRYVDQYGNPVAPPVGGIQPQVQPQPQPQIRYVNQHGQPVAPPMQQQTTRTPNVKFNTAQSNKQAAQRKNAQAAKCERISAMILGIIALVLISIGFNLNSLAYDYDYDTNYDYYCGFTEIRAECDDSYSSYTYSVSSCTDISLDYSTYCDSSILNEVGCGTESAGATTLVMMIIATVCIVFGIIMVQPCIDITPCCCRNSKQWTCSRFLFIISLLSSVIAIVVWVTGDDLCTEYLDYGIGSTIIVLGVSCVFSLLAICFARR